MRCTNPKCAQKGLIKTVSQPYLGSGVYQRTQPVCGQCDGLRDMEIITKDSKEESKEDK